MAVNITTDTNTVKVTATTTNNVKIVDNGNNTSVTVSQPTTRVIKVATVGPQGPAGTGVNISTGSFAVTGSNTFVGNQTIQGDLSISGSDNVNSTLRFLSGAVITTNGSNLDMTAGPGGWSEIGSNSGQNYVWVDDSGVYLVSSWDSNTQTSAWRILTGSRQLVAVGDLDMNGHVVTGSLLGTASFALTASYSPNYLPLTGGTITGNLTVIGTSSFTYSTASIIQVGDSTILLNTNNPATRFGGITVIDSGSFGNSSTGSLLWDSLNNKWIYSNPSGSSYDGGMLISGPRNTSGLGNEAGMDANFVAVGAGGDHIQPSTIFNSGSGTTAVTQVTGSLSVSNGITGSLFGSASYADTVGEPDIDYLMLQSFRLTYNY